MDNFKDWVRQFEICAVACGIEDDKRKCNVDGPDAQCVHENMTFVEGEKDVYDQLKTKLTYCNGR